MQFNLTGFVQKLGISDVDQWWEVEERAYPHQQTLQQASTATTHSNNPFSTGFSPSLYNCHLSKMAEASTPLLYSAPDDRSTESQSSISSTSLAEKHWFRRLTSRRNIAPFFLTLLGTLIIILAVTLLTSMDRPKRKNVVLMVSDGMGPASLSLARSYMQFTEDVEFYKQLELDPYIVGTSRTRSHGLFSLPALLPFTANISHHLNFQCILSGVAYGR